MIILADAEETFEARFNTPSDNNNQQIINRRELPQNVIKVIYERLTVNIILDKRLDKKLLSKISIKEKDALIASLYTVLEILAMEIGQEK